MTQIPSPFFSQTSCLHQILSAAEETELVGNQAALPLVNVSLMVDKIGKKLAQGDVGTIYEVAGLVLDPKRVFKFVPLTKVKTQDEISIAQIAGEMGIGPKVHAAFVMAQKSGKFVAIEMDRLGRSLREWMEVLEENPNLEEAAKISLPTLEEEEVYQEEMLQKARTEAPPDSPFIVVRVPQKKRLDLEKTVEILYGRQEDFFFALFSKLKSLAEKNIAFLDTNFGNIIPNYELGKEMGLIDFDSAVFTKRVSEAAYRILKENPLFESFSELPDLSQESQELVHWFEEQTITEFLLQQ